MAAKSTKINTTGQLREFLADALVKTVQKEIAPEDAMVLVRLAGKINDSFFSEVKIAKVNLEAGKTMAEMGDLPLNKPAQG